MILPQINWIAILVAVVAACALGSLWFSPIGFMKQWLRGIEKTEEQMRAKSAVVPMVIMVVMTVVMALGVATLYDWLGSYNVVGGIMAGAFLWVFAIMPVKVNDMNFEGRPFIIFPTNAGFYLLNFILIGAVIGLFGRTG